MKKLLENFNNYLEEQEAPDVVAKKKKNIFDLEPNMKLHKRAMNTLVKQGALNLSPMKLEPQQRRTKRVVLSLEVRPTLINCLEK